jgi:signal transduction histidine kinase/ActR/RegA family two-component response regulator
MLLRDFVERIEPVTPETFGAVVFDRFQAEPNTLAIPVVGPRGEPLGVIERHAFCLRMAAEYGRALYARRPISSLMEAPVIADASVTIERFFSGLNEADVRTLLQGFIATENGRYLGVGTPLAVLQAGFALQRRRAEEMTQLAQNLAWAEAEAQASSRAKSQFLAVMSHEIRTPLNGVLGVAELVDRKLTQTELRPYLRTIIDSGETLLRLLTDALDLSRAQAGSLTLEEEPVDLHALAADVEALWLPRAEQKGLQFTVQLEAVRDQWILADAMRLKQVFNNLIGNALKFTERGGVVVRIAAEREGVHVRLRGEVQDSGPGVPEEMREAIFEPFRTSAETRKGAGAGLGLAICRQIVEQMQGELGLRPGAGEGACFHFDVTFYDVPAQASEVVHAPPAFTCPPAPAADAQTFAPRVLVADDNATNRFVAAKLLEVLGYEPSTAEDGLQAVEMAGAQPFDVILMDIKMPGLDGVQATRAIRALGGEAARTPVIALTANADPEDAAKYLAAGMSDVVRKPLKASELAAALAAAVGSEVRAAMAA